MTDGGAAAGRARVHHSPSNCACSQATKPDTFSGSMRGDGKTACTSCAGSDHACSSGRTAPRDSASCAA